MRPRSSNIDAITDECTACLTAANDHNEQTASLALPCFYENESSNQYWHIGQQIANALQKFDAEQELDTNYLRSIDVVCVNLLTADILSNVFRNILTSHVPLTVDNETIPTEDNVPLQSSTDQVNENQSASQWFKIDEVLKRQKRRGNDFLVRWKN